MNGQCRESEVRQLSSNAEKNEDERSKIEKNLLGSSHFEGCCIYQRSAFE